MKPDMTRRRMLTLAGSSAMAALLPRQTAWAARTSRSSLRLAFFTDVHARTEWQTPEALALTAREVNRARPDVVVAGGDLITDGFQSSPRTVEPRWKAYLEMHRSIKAPVLPVVGNHDLVGVRPEDGSDPVEDPRARFKKAFGLERTYRSFDAAGCHLMLLDSVGISSGEMPYVGVIDNEQLAWIASDLSKVDTHTPIILASHLPLLTGFYQATEGSETAAPANRVVTNNLEVLKLFDGRNLQLVLQGHLHVDELLRWRQTTFITGGAICGKWWRGAWQGTKNGFGVVTLKKGRIDWQYRELDWDPKRP